MRLGKSQAFLVAPLNKLLKILQIFMINNSHTNVGGDIMFLKRKRNLMMDIDMDLHMKSMVKVAVAGVVIYQAAKFVVNQFMD